MTLFKQVALLVSLVFLLIVVTTTVGDFRRTGDFLEGQLQTAAQDMTTTLGIAISNSGSNTDVATYETLFNAVFDSGYYSNIELIAPDGTVVHRKDRVLEIENVPDWFITLVPLWPATGETQVMQGWVPLGTLRLTLHPGYVYSSLYKNLESTLWWFLILFSTGMIVLWWLLHKMLKPLDHVKQQAEAIHNNQFVIQSKIPRTVELRSVVIAMNRMIDKVHKIFDDQAATLSSYQELLYRDTQSGLSNRKYFMRQMEKLHTEDTHFHGNISVIKIHNLEIIYEKYGFQKSETIITKLSEILTDSFDYKEHEFCARLSEDEFSLLLSISAGSVQQKLSTLFEQFRSLQEVTDIQDEIYLTAGITSLHSGNPIGQTLSDMDFALSQADSNGAYSIYEKVSSEIELPQGKMQWRHWLEGCIAEERFYLVRQKVLTTDKEVVHQEVFIRLKNESGEVVPAGLFIPMANSLGLGENIDRIVFQLVKDNSNKYSDVPMALNLTESVFSHADALQEFNQLLQHFQESSSTFCVEASHHILEQHPQMCAGVAESVRNSGNVFGVDNLNFSLSLQTLQSVRPDYIKVNAKTLYDMTQAEIPAAYQALRTLTNAMDIRIIAVGVDTEELYQHLHKRGVKTMQGNLLSEPEDFL